MNLGERVRNLRKSLQMTQADFARKLGVTQGFICNVEKNRAKFTVEHVISIVNIFGVDAGVLVQGDEYQEQLLILKKRVGDHYRPSTKNEAIRRIVQELETLPYERVVEVLKYVEEKGELMYLQSLTRVNRLPKDTSKK